MSDSKPNMTRESLLSMISEEQCKRGFVSNEAIVSMAQKLGISVGEVYGVVTFYAYFSLKPQGKHIIRVCKSVPCHLKQSEMVVSWIKAHLGIEPGQTTSDGRFSLELANCIGACDQAPAMLIDDVVYGNLTQAKVAEILKSSE
ncbi:MAG: NADH-quinone oxidoreductase subunit NuoE [Deltaproteobacteria bacterium HGW-Deltaproteobacteria-12]|jgi:NADH:ubiquinone oxidoreductase subunit E|nr:MAG: NADH-quinone oxidoreductase subunit NuoE [Deltaproteobacteria bacterium HGW-Deltaproteobacteria-12]